MLEVIQEVEKDRSKPAEVALMEVKERKRERMENQQLLKLLTDSLRRLPIGNHVSDDGTSDKVSGPGSISDTLSNSAQIDQLEATFKAV